MRKLLILALFALVAATLGPAATTRPGAVAATPPRFEVLVLEIESCSVCGLVRRNILPRYQDAGLTQAAPMRFVDVTRRDETRLGLNRPIDTVPTAVLLRDGREVDRISGYVAPDLFVSMLGEMLRRLGE